MFDETPTQLIPKMGEFPVTNSAFYKQLIMTGVAGASGEGSTLGGQVDPFSGDEVFEEEPAMGVLLTFEQQWFQEGLALGELRKSLCLAPGEVTKLAVVDWRRETDSRETSERTQSEAVRSEMNDASTAVQIQRAVANEAKTGMSASSATASHTEASAGVSFLFWGASVSTGSSSQQGYAATSSTGSRDVASSASKDLERRTEQLAQSTRSARATQIRELTETEQQTTTTRVVANYNHAHALTMQYYEVLQIYSVRTKAVQAQRCVFIPMKPFEFTAESLKVADDTVIELLRIVLHALGAVEVDEMVGNFHGKAPNLEQTIKECEAKRDETRTRLDSFEANLATLKEKLDRAIANLDVAKQALLRAVPLPQDVGSIQRHVEAVTAFVSASQALASAQTEFNAANANANATRIALSNEFEAIESELTRKRNALSEFGRMFGILDQHRLLLNQQMWMRIDNYTWHRKLAGKSYPAAPYEGQAIGSLVDPTPVGYFGNYVAFAWDFPRSPEAGSDDETGDAQTESARFEYQFTGNAGTQTQVALPTEGVFAEAVLGQSNSAEKIDITRFWNWQDSPIPILPPSMAPVGTESRARDVALPAPVHFAPALAALREAGVPPDISDEALLGALQTSLLGDNAALIAAASAAGIGALDNASAGAGRAGQRVVDAMKNVQDFTVGLANSEIAKIATQAVTSGATGGLSAVGGLLNAAGQRTGSRGSPFQAIVPAIAEMSYQDRWNDYLANSTRSAKQKNEMEELLALFVSACGYFDTHRDKLLPMRNGSLDSVSQAVVDAVNEAGSSFNLLMNLMERFKASDKRNYDRAADAQKRPGIKRRNKHNQEEDQRLLDNLDEVLLNMQDQVTTAIMPT
jgi:hypothetical protein